MTRYRRPCEAFALAGDGSGLCASCAFQRDLHEDQCPACHRAGMKGKRHKARPGGLWCDGEPNRLRDRASSFLLMWRAKACEDDAHVEAYRHGVSLVMAGRYKEAVTFLSNDCPRPPPATTISAPRKLGRLIQFRP